MFNPEPSKDSQRILACALNSLGTVEGGELKMAMERKGFQWFMLQFTSERCLLQATRDFLPEILLSFRSVLAACFHLQVQRSIVVSEKRTVFCVAIFYFLNDYKYHTAGT